MSTMLHVKGHVVGVLKKKEKKKKTGRVLNVDYAPCERPCLNVNYANHVSMSTLRPLVGGYMEV